MIPHAVAIIRSIRGTVNIDVPIISHKRIRKVPIKKTRHCYYCDEIADTMDHVIPRSKGGKNGKYNLVPACRWCNSTKSSASKENFIQFIEFLKVKLPTFPKEKPERKRIGREIVSFYRHTGIKLREKSIMTVKVFSPEKSERRLQKLKK